ncbi:Aste57867_20346 [Aphanomyces stellatus]|uniref:Aste57867_20346 protein n=1 Tax=Aphanomyces stellatus TaxID=120398 RepID=A0A485LG96_9STRA|nr:hypothetical protein As57867_020280 [Aphanomyces stellatus]VFT97033.1 Aste57867_20346 [Aphanomyces stellatus]
MQPAMSLLFLCVCLAAVAQVVHCDPRENENRMGFDDADLSSNSIAQSKRGYSFDLEHSISLDGKVGVFSSRGEVAIDFERAKPAVTFPTKVVLNDAQRASFQKLLSQNGFYTVRARSEPGNPNSAFVVASVPSCFLVKNRFREDLAFHVNDVGNLISIEFRTPAINAIDCASVSKRNVKDASFTSIGSVALAVDGPEVLRVATAAKVAVPQGVKPVKDENAPADEENQSLFRKYWYIIVPVMILLLSGGGSDPAPVQGAAAGGAARR